MKACTGRSERLFLLSPAASVGGLDLEIRNQQQIENIHSIFWVEDYDGSAAGGQRNKLPAHDRNRSSIGYENRKRSKRRCIQSLLESFDGHVHQLKIVG